MFQEADFTLPFRDRKEAGRLLARRLLHYAHRSDVLILTLPRGGVPVGAEIATALEAPLAVFVVRKLGVPGHEEFAMGAVTTGGRKLINRSITVPFHISQFEINSVVQRELQEVGRRERLFNRGRKMPDLKDKIVVITDDGIATGSSMMLAVQALRAQGAAYIVVAVPVAPSDQISMLHRIANEVVCLAKPEPFVAVGRWYEDFRQISDHDVCVLLDQLFERSCLVQTA